MSEQLRADLEAALAVIPTPQSWCKRALAYSGGAELAHCAFGAVHLAVLGDFSWAAVREAEGYDKAAAWRVLAVKGALLDALPARYLEYGTYSLYATRHDAVVAFNNADATTHADIVALFQRAIKAVIDEGNDE
jgi:hypothetical protein